MPYFWQRIQDLYNNHPNEDWNSSPGAIIGDLAWFFLDQDDTPEKLRESMSDASQGGENSQWREPYPDEVCRFKTWYDQIVRSDVTQGWRNDIMKTLFQEEDSHPIDLARATTVLHMVPCSVIRGFIAATQENIDDWNDCNQSEASYDTEETIIVESEEDRDGRQSPFIFHGYGLANRPDSDADSDDTESDSSDSDSDSESDDNSMPELENEDDHEEEELRTNRWTIIRHQWQHTITPREYNEIIEDGGGHRIGGALRHFLQHGEPMDIDTDEEDSDVEMHYPSQGIRV